MIMNSNHPIKNIDTSLRRRFFINGFPDYYHPEDVAKKIKLRDMFTEFGKNLITDYTEEEMNKFYNFMAYCLNF